MRNFLILWRRELAACFLSPIAYVTTVVFLAASGATFLALVVHNVGTTNGISPLFFASSTVWLTVLVTVVCMRLFAEEKRSGTLEPLMTAPVTEAQVVLGKYAGALTFVLAAAVPALAAIPLLAAWSPAIALADADAGAVLGGALITALAAAFWVALGLVVSLLTRNQIVAAIGCLCAVWAALVFGDLLLALPLGPPRLGRALSTIAHVEDFSRGALDLAPMVLYAAGAAVCLFAAVRLLESRRGC